MYRCDQCAIGPRGHGFEGALSLIAFIKNPKNTRRDTHAPEEPEVEPHGSRADKGMVCCGISHARANGHHAYAATMPPLPPSSKCIFQLVLSLARARLPEEVTPRRAIELRLWVD